MADTPTTHPLSAWSHLFDSRRAVLQSRRGRAAAALAELEQADADNKARLLSIQDDLDRCRATVDQLEASLPGLRATAIESIIEPAEEALESHRDNLDRCERDLRSVQQEHDLVIQNIEQERQEVSRADQGLAALEGKAADIDAAAAWLAKASNGAQTATRDNVEAVYVGWKAYREQEALVGQLEQRLEQCEEDKQVLQVRLDRREQEMQRTAEAHKQEMQRTEEARKQERQRAEEAHQRAEQTVKSLSQRIADLEAREAEAIKSATATNQPRPTTPSAGQYSPGSAPSGGARPGRQESASEARARAIHRMVQGGDMPADCQQQ